MILLLTILASACSPPQLQQENIRSLVSADGQDLEVILPSGSTAADAIEEAGIVLASVDRTDPSGFTILSDGAVVRVFRIIEEYIIEEDIIPYETQFIQNESLPEGERRLIQAGVNGISETTYLLTFEDGVQISRTVARTSVIEEPVPSVVMIGSQSQFTSFNIPGQIAYLSAGNAWIMDGNTGSRRPVITTGDLDGRVFSLSDDGAWLLFTRADSSEDRINMLWAARFDLEEPILVNLGIENVIHFADWVPGSNSTIVYSTARVNPNPPGWQADNNLNFVDFTENGWVSQPRITIEENTGGLYGWWGTEFVWSISNQWLLFSRPDSLGVVDFDRDDLIVWQDISPLQTRSNWAWVSGAGLSPDDSILYYVEHLSGEEEGQDQFNLISHPLRTGRPVIMVYDVGMFAYPAPSPNLSSDAVNYYVAFLQGIDPQQSLSTYQLFVMDQDGSNLRRIFPQGEQIGLDPQRIRWLPNIDNSDYPLWVAMIYQGNLWLFDMETGDTQQLTGDGLITAIDWK